MITIYNKVEKSMDNTSGFQVVQDIELLQRPFLLCISAKNNLSKSIFGIMREGAQAARVQTTQGPAGRFKLDEFPIDFLGIRFEKDKKYKQACNELADKFFYPFLTRNGHDLDSLRSQARKINVFTYCDGAFTYQGAEKRLVKLLEDDGLDEEYIHWVLSQISLTTMESTIDAGTLHATSISFMDVNDLEIECEEVIEYRKILEEEKHKSLYSAVGDFNHVLFVYKGTGIHNIKKFFQNDNCVAKPAVCSVVSMFLENSLENELLPDFFPIIVEQIISRLNDYAKERIGAKHLLIRLDKALSYHGTPRYTKASAEERMELDAVYKLLRKTNEMFIRTLEDKQGQEIRLNTLIRGIHEFSSDITFEQILTYAHMWHPKEGRNILSKPSDKQVRYSVIDEEE